MNSKSEIIHMRTKMVLIFVSLICIAFLSGCASAPPPTGHSSNMTWYQPGVSAEQTKRDLAASQYYAMVNAGGYSVQGGTVGQTVLLSMFAESQQQKREKQMVQSRMTALGYTLVKTNSPLLNVVPIADVNIFEREKDKAEKGDAEAQFNLGNLYYTGFTNDVCRVAVDYTESIEWFQKAAGQNYPNIQLPLASAYAKRGYAEQANGDLDTALADYNKAIEVKPDLTELYVLRGYIKQCKADLGGAMADYDKAIELNPQLPIVYPARGLANYDLHKYAESLADFRKACELSTDVDIQDTCRIYIWLIRAQLGEQDAATKELETYLNNRKRGTPDDWELNVALFLTGQLTEADFFKVAKNVNAKIDKEQNCEAYFYAATKRLIMGDKVTAIAYFQKCLATGQNACDEFSSAKIELEYLTTTK